MIFLLQLFCLLGGFFCYGYAHRNGDIEFLDLGRDLCCCCVVLGIPSIFEVMFG